MHSSVILTRWKLSIHGLWEQSTFAHKHKHLTRNGDGRWQDCPHRSPGNARPPAKLYRPPFDSRWCPCRWRIAKKLTNDSRFKTCALYEAFLVRSGQPFQESQALCCSRFLCSRRVPDKTLVGQPFYLPMQWVWSSGKRIIIQSFDLIGDN